MAALLTAGVGRVRLEWELFLLKRRYGWRRLRLIPSADGMDAQVRGSMSPEEVLADAHTSIGLIQTGVHVRVSGAAANRPKAYEQAASQAYVRDVLSPELFPDVPTEITVPGKRRRSAKSMVRLSAQHGLKRGKLSSGHGQSRPEFLAERLGPIGRDAPPIEVHAVEVTMNSTWEYEPKGSPHKATQSFTTVATLLARYPHPSTQITYHIIAPQTPSSHTRNYLEGQVLGRLSASDRARIRIVWRVVPIASGVVAVAVGGRP